MHSKDLPESRREFLIIQGSLSSNCSHQLIIHAILLLSLVIMCTQAFLNLSFNSSKLGQTITLASVLILLGAALVIMIGRIIFYENLSNFVNSIRYDQIEFETIRNLRTQDLIIVAKDNWEKQWNANMAYRYLFRCINVFGAQVFSSWKLWITSFLGGIIFLLIYFIFQYLHQLWWGSG